MANFARIQNRIYYGYGKAAIHLGVTHDIYRSATAVNPIDSGNLIDSLLVSVDEDLKYNKPSRYGHPTWQFLPEDGLTLQNFDFMVGSITYFIVDIAPTDRLSPPLCIECDNVVTITRPSNPLSAGANGYSQYQPGTATPLYTSCPAALIEYSRGDNSTSMKIPTSVKMPQYKVFLPLLGGVQLQTGDILQDANNNRYAISSVEQTTLGYRLLAQVLGG
jgi:hypothetical protein